MNDTEVKRTKLPLDPSRYNLQGERLEFYRKATGIEDEDQLKEHILAVQKKGYEVSILMFFSIVL